MARFGSMAYRQVARRLTPGNVLNLHLNHENSLGTLVSQIIILAFLSTTCSQVLVNAL